MSESIPPSQYEEDAQRFMPVDRLNGFSDGVFAVAITLLVLDISVPVIGSQRVSVELWNRLLDLHGHVFAFALSFFIVGLYWTVHHRQFHFIRRTDMTLLWLNLLFLFWVVMVPFSSSLIGQYGDYRLAASVYAGNLVLIGITDFFIWRYATWHCRLVDPNIANATVQAGLVNTLGTTMGFLLSFPLVYFGANVMEISWVITTGILPRFLPRIIARFG